MSEKAKPQAITHFSYTYAFLSNFSASPVLMDGVWYPSVECAYQAAKTTDPKLREPFIKYKPGVAKREGRKLSLRDNWDGIKNGIMLDLLREKFKITHLKQSLLATGNAELEEHNWWHDVHFGICDGKCKEGPHKPQGENWLGKLLMQVREELKAQ